MIIRVADIIYFVTLFNIEGWKQPLYSIPEYEYAIFNNSIIEYLIFDMGIKYIGVLFWGIVTFFISYIFMDNVRTLAVGIVTFCGTIFLCLNYKNAFNPVALFIPIELVKKFEVVNILGFPIYYYQIVIAVPLMIIVLITIILVINRRSLACRR